jgi:hypothetical protein
MDFSRLSPDELAWLRTLLQVPSASVSSSATNPGPIASGPLASSISPLTTVSSPPSSLPAAQVQVLPASQQRSVHFLDPPLVPPGIPAAACPITQLYQGSQALGSGHPSSTPTTPSFQPFLRINTLSLNVATGHANQACLASASASLPRQPALACRGRHTRGPAIHPPSLPLELAPGSSLRIQSCFVSGTSEPVV